METLEKATENLEVGMANWRAEEDRDRERMLRRREIASLTLAIMSLTVSLLTLAAAVAAFVLA